jgi:hypothetical protein
MEGGWKFVQDEMLGLQASHGGVTLLTSAPFIDYQMSTILVDILGQMRQNLLGRLERLARENNPNLWYILFLVTYILLHSYGKLAKQQAQFARNRGLPVRSPQSLKATNQMLIVYCSESLPFDELDGRSAAGKPALAVTSSPRQQRKVHRRDQVETTEHVHEHCCLVGRKDLVDGTVVEENQRHPHA